MYQDKSLKVDEIADMFGVSRETIKRIAISLGAKPRHNIKSKSLKKCPNCNKLINIPEARFCCYCGSDIRTAKELLIERISNAMRIIKYLPIDVKDEIQKLFIDIKDNLKE